MRLLALFALSGAVQIYPGDTIPVVEPRGQESLSKANPPTEGKNIVVKGYPALYAPDNSSSGTGQPLPAEHKVGQIPMDPPPFNRTVTNTTSSKPKVTYLHGSSAFNKKCKPCMNRTTCQECLECGSCGWCGTGCYYGSNKGQASTNAFGEAQPYCNEKWHWHKCPPPQPCPDVDGISTDSTCVKINDTAWECTGEPYGGPGQASTTINVPAWCMPSKAPDDAEPAPAGAPTEQQECPGGCDTETTKTCEGCTACKNCGWYEDSSMDGVEVGDKCYAGDATGPSADGGTAPSGFFWHFTSKTCGHTITTNSSGVFATGPDGTTKVISRPVVTPEPDLKKIKASS